MKRWFTALILGLMVSLQACAQVELWQEGKHYEVIAEKASKKPVVSEYFSFWCPACMSFEPLVAKFKAGLPENAKFVKVHVNFMGFASRDIQEVVTKAMMIGRAMKEEEKYNTAIFNYLQKQRGTVTELNDLRNLFIVNGADGETFDKLASGFGINSLVKKNNKNIEDFRQHLTGVPTFIVNEKFKATFSKDMTVDDMVNLVAWLTKQR